MSWGSGLTDQHKKIKGDEHSRKRDRSQLVAIPDSNSSTGSASSRISLRATRRGNSKSDVSPSCGPFPHQQIITVSFSPSYVGFSKNWFVVSTKFLVDDHVCGGGDEECCGGQLGRRRQHGATTGKTFRLNGQQFAVRRLRDWGPVEHALGTSARICTSESCCAMASPCSKGSVSVRRRNAT